MKIIVFSDSHGDTNTLNKIVYKHKEEIGTYLFLGDGVSGIKTLQYQHRELDFVAVNGNNDFGYNYPDKQILTFGEEKIFMTHGHRYSSWDFKNAIKKEVKKHKISIVLFGHLHVPSIEKEKNILFLCPGSVTLPRGGSEKSYAILDIDDKNAKGEIIRVKDGF